MSIRLVLLILLSTLMLAGCGSDGGSSAPSKATDARADAPDPAQVEYIEEFGAAFADELTEPGSAQRAAFLECFNAESDGMPVVSKDRWAKLANELSTPCRQQLSSGSSGPID